MNPPGKTTLSRMQATAIEEQERIEISQDGRVREGLLKEPMPSQVAKRDDFAGMVRLIDIIVSDKVLLDRLQERMVARAGMASPAPKLIDTEKDVAVDEWVET
jgi:hypothetical protein